MKKKTILVHIGYPKTATTALQKHYFPRLETINYLGKFYDQDVHSVLDKLDSDILGILELGDANSALSKSKEFSRKLYDLLDERPALVSEERISGSFFTPRLISHGERKISNAASSAQTIRNLFDEDLFHIKILVTLRRQDDALASKYAQSFLKTYSVIPNLNTFEKFIDDILNHNDSFIRRGYNYLHTVKAYEEVFGRESLLVLPYELMNEHPSDFFDALLLFLGVDERVTAFDLNKRENVRSSVKKSKKHTKKSLYHVLSDIKRVIAPGVKLPQKFKKLKKLKRIKLPYQKDPGSIYLDEKRASQIRKLYADSNYQLSCDYQLGLDRYGYCKLNSGEEMKHTKTSYS